MRIARIEASDGRVGYAAMESEHRARPLQGDLFARPQPGSASVDVRRLLAPLEPPNIFCIGRNYRAHAEEFGNVAPEQPLIFQKPTTALLDPEQPIVLPRSAPERVDYEGELVIVIGRRARDVSESEALDCVLGFTCANDVSARDCQKSDKQWARAKGFDTFCPLGPWIVTPDEFDPNDCRVRTRVNGELRQDARSSQMIHSCVRLISYLSQQFTLLPGTLILTGTPEGVGAARNPPVYLRAGDRVEVEIDGIGRLANPVAAAG